MREDEIIVDNYIFWDFDQKVTHIVYFRYKKISQSFEEDDKTKIKTLFSQIGLWENYINIKKVINEEIKSGESLSTLMSEYSSDKLDIKFGEHKLVSICTVSYSKNEALRKTEGRKTNVDLSIESFRKYLINLNKWLILKNNKKMLEN